MLAARAKIRIPESFVATSNSHHSAKQSQPRVQLLHTQAWSAYLSSTGIFRPSYSRHITWIIQARIRILAGILEEEAITRRWHGESNPMDIRFPTVLTGHDIVDRCGIHILIQDDTLKFIGLSGRLATAKRWTLVHFQLLDHNANKKSEWTSKSHCNEWSSHLPPCDLDMFPLGHSLIKASDQIHSSRSFPPNHPTGSTSANDVMFCEQTHMSPPSQVILERPLGNAKRSPTRGKVAKWAGGQLGLASITWTARAMPSALKMYS